MKTISEFYKIRIGMEFQSNQPPNIQASYGQKKAIFSIESGEMIDVINGEFDDFPYDERCLVTAWMTIHKDELMKNWEKLKKDPNIPIYIAPLQ
jgi:hypothetical protein